MRQVAGRLPAALQVLSSKPCSHEEYSHLNGNRLNCREAPLGQRTVAAARDFIALNRWRPLTPGKVASGINVNLSHLGRLFRIGLKQTLTGYLDGIRVQNARALLAGSRQPITQVSAEAGFPSIARLDAVFKKLVGTTPSRYRRELETERARQAVISAEKSKYDHKIVET